MLFRLTAIIYHFAPIFLPCTFENQGLALSWERGHLARIMIIDHVNLRARCQRSKEPLIILRTLIDQHLQMHPFLPDKKTKV
ncbi:MAG: hypothetical protein Q7J38_05005, partial [Gallionella sp.]|nr:hypothetical protein [Gallionella sp.]